MSEDNEFTAEIFITPTPASTKKAAKPTPRPKVEMFARISERRADRMVGQRGCVHDVFHFLMIYSVKSFNHPFALPVEYLTKKTGLNRRAQLKALRALAKVGVVKFERVRPYELPTVSIPGTTKSSYLLYNL